ncbi:MULTISPECIES: CD225/dispanin family protein [unclassified Thermosynechococcus]|nr:MULTISPECIES: CD225/dispanin family protein [unclassified Thermosynechococcus]WKT85033.1 CD225/dispanin family protein [Thermosynechococcus sp. HY596]WNC64163.1 CD225/dispanin family protein [Thermosynechococcus sp. HY591]WNC66732.1 CD225/dispanin family protein [Thermosynechococcus sp. HY593]
MVPAILSTICCCLPFGIVAIIAISKGDEIFSRGISYPQSIMNVTQEYEL